MQFTFTIPDAQVPRIRAWMLSVTDPGTNPETGEPNPPLTDAELLSEFKRKVRGWIKGEVQQYELLEEHKAIFEQYTQIDVTE